MGKHDHVLQHILIAVFFGEIAPVFLGVYRCSVSQMIVAGDQVSFAGQIFRKALVTVDEFDHTVSYLQDGFDFTLRHIAHGSDLREAVGTVKIEFFFTL